MTLRTLLSERLRSHRLSAPARTPVAAAEHMLAVQAQDFGAGRWALAARSAGSPTMDAVDTAFDEGALVRTWPMRGTLHILPACDVRWVLGLTADRQRRQDAGRMRELGIDDAVVGRARDVLVAALSGGGLARAELFAAWMSAGIDPGGQRGNHLLAELSWQGLIVQGPVVHRDGAASREQCFVLADGWLPDVPAPDDPLAEFFLRYVDGHGPATAEDFAWWSGLTLTQARDAAARGAVRTDRITEVDEGVFLARTRPRRSPKANGVLTLGAFEEFYISYADRSPVADAAAQKATGPGRNGMVRPIILAEGRIVGNWTHSLAVGRHREEPVAEMLDPAIDPGDVRAALSRYADFVTG
ncbi:winged helix DNA-binding domain-containing protein [Microbacterium pseudoresistens]|uniref:Winged helix DNA-binding domain-containing protein n=1 Tax=Microbacterium pseudoresistens TaxID=640634 RepID=A0A7Y9EVY7_9MICO|nr:winged helix DNA-binding domain-containing protein [Microbacterium pseudoresistens]NYD54814.1 hypothetical protein [Microbacterium pseudoresistens]